MKSFLLKILYFILIGVLLFFIGLHTPQPKIVETTALYALKDKNILLKTTKDRRIIFIGGSNISFGLNSQTIKDSLHINPINMGIHAGIGLKYMLRTSVKYVKKNDIFVLIPEYTNYNGNSNGVDGGLVLLTILFDVAPETKKEVDIKQWYHLLRNMPEYLSKKLKFTNHFRTIDTSKVGIFNRKSFNSYGDAYIHWTQASRKVEPTKISINEFNESTMELLKWFKAELSKKNAKLYISFPGLQSSTVKKSMKSLNYIEKKLLENNFVLLGTPQKYSIPDSLIFNTVYHLSKKGVDYRTALLIEDLKKQGL